MRAAGFGRARPLLSLLCGCLLRQPTDIRHTRTQRHVGDYTGIHFYAYILPFPPPIPHSSVCEGKSDRATGRGRGEQIIKSSPPSSDCSFVCDRCFFSLPIYFKTRNIKHTHTPTHIPKREHDLEIFCRPPTSLRLHTTTRTPLSSHTRTLTNLAL